MSGYSQNSLNAFKRIDRESGLQTLVRYFQTQPPGFALTRKNLSIATGMPYETVCGRVNDGLHQVSPPVFDKFGNKDGKELIGLKVLSTKGDSNGRERVLGQDLATDSERGVGADSDGRRMRVVHDNGTDGGGAEDGGAWSGPSGGGLRDSRGRTRLHADGGQTVAIVPYLPHRNSISLDEAQRTDSPEAKMVRELGKPFRIWGTDLNECMRVAKIINA